MYQLIIFDFDGTLFDTHEFIQHCITGTFQTFQPESPVDTNEVQRSISKGTGLYDTFRALERNLETYDEKEWEKIYRELYATEGQALIKAFPGGKQLLSDVRDEKIPLAIVTNKGVAAVQTALENNGLPNLVPPELIVGDKTPGNTTRKPDIGSFVNVLEPALRAHHGLTDVDRSKILVVGDTEADIQYAKNLGAQSCWCNHGYGLEAACCALRPDYTVASLAEVATLLVDYGSRME